ncbi:hypothetical protein [Uliginosibacterium sp. 31-12]|uniref:hypothetical protein n=1 Tax=Uliginosibacterium sp. 31-12 TaxID=3062781 RepID=UPI0026E2AFAE|nr:hypothetical protein [Uliginosibacterium sp. 31-12]MDO6385599.1 hypothetical protein [Uliginosibacterium sp. 31-12]
MLDVQNVPGIHGLRKSAEAHPLSNALAQRTPAATKLAAAKAYLAEIGGARPGVLDRWLENKESTK